MPEPLRVRGGLSLAQIAMLTSAKLTGDRARRIDNIAALDSAGSNDICFLDDERFLGDLAATRAGACFMRPRFAALAPAAVAVLVSEEPYRAFVAAARALFADAAGPRTLFETAGRSPGAHVHVSARVEAGVTVDPLALIGPRAQVGAGTVIGAGAALGPDVCIGRRCAIGAGVTITNALIGDRVIVHAGARLGQDGLGHRGDAKGPSLPPVRRLIIQDDAEIGANTVIDRGALRDTIVGEGSKIDNLVQIAHNVRIGRHCLIGAQCGIADGVTVGDFVIMQGRVAIAENIAVGDGARLVGRHTIVADVVSGARFDSSAQPRGDVP